MQLTLQAKTTEETAIGVYGNYYPWVIRYKFMDKEYQAGQLRSSAGFIGARYFTTEITKTRSFPFGSSVEKRDLISFDKLNILQKSIHLLLQHLCEFKMPLLEKIDSGKRNIYIIVDDTHLINFADTRLKYNKFLETNAKPDASSYITEFFEKYLLPNIPEEDFITNEIKRINQIIIEKNSYLETKTELMETIKKEMSQAQQCHDTLSKIPDLSLINDSLRNTQIIKDIEAWITSAKKCAVPSEVSRLNDKITLLSKNIKSISDDISQANKQLEILKKDLETLHAFQALKISCDEQTSHFVEQITKHLNEAAANVEEDDDDELLDFTPSGSF